jgi:hypothetical protein
MKIALKYLFFYLISSFFELITTSFFEKSTTNSELFFVVYLIIVFYGWMFFVPLLIMFRLGLIGLYKYFNYKGLFLICTLWGAAVNSIKVFFTASNISYLQTLPFLISGVVFGTFYYLFFLFPFNNKINK